MEFDKIITIIIYKEPKLWALFLWQNIRIFVANNV